MNKDYELQLLDRIYIVSDSFDRNVFKFINDIENCDENILNKITEVSENLSELYQLILK